MTTNDPRARLLRGALRGNAFFSATSGLILFAFGGSVASFLGAANATEMLALGGQLAIFAAWLAWLSSRSVISRWQVALVIALDLVWVAGSAATLLSPPPALTMGGKWAIAFVADVVGLFAILQFVGLRRITRTRLRAGASG